MKHSICELAVYRNQNIISKNVLLSILLLVTLQTEGRALHPTPVRGRRATNNGKVERSVSVNSRTPELQPLTSRKLTNKYSHSYSQQIEEEKWFDFDITQLNLWKQSLISAKLERNKLKHEL